MTQIIQISERRKNHVCDQWHCRDPNETNQSDENFRTEMVWLHQTYSMSVSSAVGGLTPLRLTDLPSPGSKD